MTGKMLSSISLRAIKNFIAFIALATVFASCTQTGEPGSDAQLRVATISLASQTDLPDTRATSGNTWQGNETVRVNINGTAYPFSVSTSGVLTCGSLYWNDFASGIDAYAWYPANYSYPADQSAGVQAADFIFAEKVTGITAANFNTDHKLTFKHKTAKVTVTLTAGTSDGVPSVSGATVKFYGYTEVDAIDSAGVTPSGAITGKTMDWISPYNTGNDTCTALLIPHAYANTNILKVTVDGMDYFWKPSSFTFEEGKAYVLDITVKKNELSVNVTGNGATWNAGNTTDVTATIPVTGVSLDQTQLFVEDLQNMPPQQLTATVAPSNASIKTVTWRSSNNNVATVVDGLVTPLAAGAATITITTVDGGKTANCEIIVPYFIQNGAYSGPPNISGVTFPRMTDLTGTFGFAVSGNLLLYPSDFAKTAWDSAKTACANLGAGWRLPNLAELGSLQNNRVSYGLRSSDPNIMYWSNTELELNGERAYRWIYYMYHAVDVAKSNTNGIVRCVKSLP